MAADRVRDEAERLVAAALAAVSSATRGLGAPGSSFATGSAECCVCPVCRAIAAMRDPNSDLAERLTAGVGDLATGVAAILRTLSTRGGRPPEAEERSASDGDEFWEGLRRKASDAARAYGRPSTRDSETSTMDDDPWRVATTQDVAGAPEDDVATTAETLVPRPTVAKKTVAKKAVAKKVVPPAAAPEAGATPAGGTPAVAKKTVAKKAMAKKAGKRAAPLGGAE